MFRHDPRSPQWWAYATADLPAGRQMASQIASGPGTSREQVNTRGTSLVKLTLYPITKLVYHLTVLECLICGDRLVSIHY